MAVMKRILISNDDGIDAPGLAALEKALSPLGEVYTVAPDRERSASSHSLTLKHPLRVTDSGKQRWSVDGTPADAVHLALYGLFKDIKFDLVASGINRGANMGDDITYSGTVGAAIEGAISKIPTMAISLNTFNPPFHWDSAIEYAAKVGNYLLMNGLSFRGLLNVNVPNTPLDQIKSVRFTSQCAYHNEYEVVKRDDPRGYPYYWIGEQYIGYEKSNGTDIAAVSQGYVSITPLQLDLTSYEDLERFSGIEI